MLLRVLKAQGTRATTNTQDQHHTGPIPNARPWHQDSGLIPSASPQHKPQYPMLTPSTKVLMFNTIQSTKTHHHCMRHWCPKFWSN